MRTYLPIFLISVFLFLLMSLTSLTSCGTVGALKIEGVKPKRNPFSVAWSKNNDPDYDTGNLPIALNSPLIFKGILYSGHNAGYMIAYDAWTGREKWRKKDSSAYHSSPFAHKDQLVYGTAQGRVYSRDLLNGKLKYVIDLGSPVESSGVVYKGLIFFHTRNHKLFCLDVETGKIIWAYKRSVPYDTTIQRVSRPTIHNGKLYVGFADGHVASFSVEEGVLLWERRLALGTKFVDVDSSPVFFNEQLYIGSIFGPLVVLDPTTGKIIKRMDFTVTRAPIKHMNNLLMGTDKGELVFFDKYYRVISKKKISEDAISGITRWKNKLVVSTIGGKLYLVAPTDYRVIDHFELGNPSSAVFGTLSVENGRLALLSSRNRLYVFR